MVVQDEGKSDTPDSVFPNNWLSFHEGRKYVTYPMYAENRRAERNIDVFEKINQNGPKC